MENKKGISKSVISISIVIVSLVIGIIVGAFYINGKQSVAVVEENLAGGEISLTYSDEENLFGFANSCKDVVDIYSRMYASTTELIEMKDNLDKPLVLCEYSHAMGNSCGDLNDYEMILENEPSYCGGFVWEFINHSIIVGEKQLYGGDFNDNPNDGNFCMDGLVGIDRELYPEISDLKHIFSYVKVEKINKN